MSDDKEIDLRKFKFKLAGNSEVIKNYFFDEELPKPSDIGTTYKLELVEVKEKGKRIELYFRLKY